MRLLLLIVFVLFFYVAAQAQNVVYVTAAETYDKVKISASFAGSDLSLDDFQGIQAELDAKIMKAGYFRLGGVFHYSRPCFDCGASIDTYSAGPQVSYDVFNERISLFGRALFGATVDYQGAKAFTRTYGGGVDINLGHVFVRPFVLDFVRVEGVPITVNRYGAGGGVRF